MKTHDWLLLSFTMLLGFILFFLGRDYYQFKNADKNYNKVIELGKKAEKEYNHILNIITKLNKLESEYNTEIKDLNRIKLKIINLEKGILLLDEIKSPVPIDPMNVETEIVYRPIENYLKYYRESFLRIKFKSQKK